MERKCVECFTASSSVHSQSPQWMDGTNQSPHSDGGWFIYLSIIDRQGFLLLPHQKQVYFLSLMGMFIWTVHYFTIWLSLDWLTLPLSVPISLNKGLSWVCMLNYSEFLDFCYQSPSSSPNNTFVFRNSIEMEESGGGRADCRASIWLSLRIHSVCISHFSALFLPVTTHPQNA